MGAARLGGFLVVTLITACATPQRQQPAEPAAPVAAPAAATTKLGAKPAKTPAKGAATVSPAAQPARTEPAAQPARTEPAAQPARTEPAAQPAKTEPAAPVAAAEKAAPTLDLKSLETRLKDTKAIGFFTKVGLKNQVDDLLDQFRALYQGQGKATLAELRRPYELLLMKVLAAVQDADPDLAHAIASSREAIWGILSDPAKFAAI